MVDESKVNIIDTLPIHVFVEIMTFLFAGPVLRRDIHCDYKTNVYPLLLASPTLWNNVMIEPKFRFWFSIMKTRYYRDINMRQNYAIPSMSTLDDQSRFMYRFRIRGDDCRDSGQRVYIAAMRKRKIIGPVMHHISYYNNMKSQHQLGLPFFSTEAQSKSDSSRHENDVYMLFYKYLIKKYRGRVKDVAFAEIELDFERYYNKQTTD